MKKASFPVLPFLSLTLVAAAGALPFAACDNSSPDADASAEGGPLRPPTEQPDSSVPPIEEPDEDSGTDGDGGGTGGGGFPFTPPAKVPRGDGGADGGDGGDGEAGVEGPECYPTSVSHTGSAGSEGAPLPMPTATASSGDTIRGVCGTFNGASEEAWVSLSRTAGTTIYSFLCSYSSAPGYTIEARVNNVVQSTFTCGPTVTGSLFLSPTETTVLRFRPIAPVTAPFSYDLVIAERP
jgi:hypothetical protein